MRTRSFLLSLSQFSVRQFFFLPLFILILPLPSFSQAISLTGKAYEKHAEIEWNAYAGADRYEVWRKGPGEKIYTKIITTPALHYLDWTESSTQVDRPYDYFINALNIPGTLIQKSDTIHLIESLMSDEEFLDMTQEYTFRYFYEYAHPVSGMARERLGSDEIVTTGGSGFGVMAILVGVYRGYITREEGADRILKIIGFLQFADRFHGVFPHWMNGNTGDVIPFGTFDDGGDLVETAFLMEGLLTARSFFNLDNPEENAIRQVITGLWEDVEWDWYSRNDSGVLYWHWSPNYGWQMNFPIRGYNEALIVYLLAIASPTHPVDASYYHTGWAGSGYKNGNSWYGYKLFVGPHLGGPLFFAHYSFMGFDPREKKDAYANYFQQNINHTLINRSWCIANPLHFDGYDENTWGLTASDDPWGYAAHAPGNPGDNGTITPAAGIPSMPYTPDESIALLKNLYRTYGDQLWGEYGFYDAFNLSQNWFDDSYIAIDEGPIINMIENYRSALLWNAFMANPEIQPALDAIGFVADPVATHYGEIPNEDWQIYPTISKGSFQIILPGKEKNYSLLFFDQSGHQIRRVSKVKNDVSISLSKDTFGWIWAVLEDGHSRSGSKPVYIQH